jgi:hypothetical protein
VDLVLAKEHNLGLVTMLSLIYKAMDLVINTSIDLAVAGLEITGTNLSVKCCHLKDRPG